ncbi:hypothetical protein E5Q_03483 [Mixia osmundae IAM 14324]|uniref:L-2-hydroxyglutarate dehydrogenase, mitochondrial n=1 Tax=Mixia osmundae (strain CBS 9802 / IAM 14324 / JCM 22182 / KY 12970) TaxID=764103 RepID=G7E1V1_MIXOS|nr:hypothetical protein E5Q_03483 [Mixia osmundae IAM 14324]
MASLLRRAHSYVAPTDTVDHLVIGGGVVGMAIARELAKIAPTFVIERNENTGMETSNRGSWVVHSGIYYPEEAHKTKLCIRGRQLLYKYCLANDVPHRKVGKLIIATSGEQVAHLDKLHEKGKRLGIPLQMLSGAEARELEPDLSPNCQGALHSPETGIVDGRKLIDALHADVIAAAERYPGGGGEVLTNHRVVRIDRHASETSSSKRGKEHQQYVVQIQTGANPSDNMSNGETSAVLAKCVINAAGLSAHHIMSHLRPPDDPQPIHYCKGSYFAYQGEGAKHVRRLLYPCPDPDFAGLGTHLTMNLDGNIRFGPDTEWLKAPNDAIQASESDWWQEHLAPTESRMAEAIQAVKTYLPNVVDSGFSPDYAGIRPKLKPEGQAADDFSITHPYPNFINLLGIESPGLTSSLAIAEYVRDLVKREVWGLGRSHGKVISGAGRLDEQASAWA